MSSLLGGDTGAAQKAQLAAQEKRTAALEKEQAAQLASRRKAMGSGAGSKTIFAAVEGIGAETAKKAKLGE